MLQFNEEIQTYFFKKDLHIIYRGSIDHVLNEEWYKKRKENSDEERLRVYTKAVNIMLDDMLKTHYDVMEYKSSTNFLKDVKNDIPQTLLTVLEILLTTSKRSSDGKKQKINNTIFAIAHIIISAIKPRSFMSPILLGLSSMMHRKHASKGLIDCISNLGLCASYYDTQLCILIIYSKISR